VLLDKSSVYVENILRKYDELMAVRLKTLEMKLEWFWGCHYDIS
jgi:hypothetical protein